MIITCPECSNRYQVDNALIRTEGRQVRCSSCGHEWTHVPQGADTAETWISPSRDRIGDGSVSSRGMLTTLAGWGSFVLAAGAFGLYLSGGMPVLTAYLPQLQHLQAHWGMTSSAGLSLENTYVTEPYLGHFVVHGEIENTSRQTLHLSRLRVKALSVDGEEKYPSVLQEWSLPLSKNIIHPGEKVAFESAPYPRVRGANKIIVSF